MVVFCCPKCKMVDIGEENEQKNCMRCGIPMLSLGLTSGEWNRLNNEQMKSSIEDCLAVHEESNLIQQDIVEENESSLYDEQVVHIDDSTIESDNTETEVPVQEDFIYTSDERDISPQPVFQNPPTDTQPAIQVQRNGAASKKKVITVDRNTTTQESKSRSATNNTKVTGNTYSANNNSGSYSKLAIVGLVLSVLGCTSIVGIVIGIIDLTKKDGRKHALSYASIIIGSMMLVGTLGFSSIQTNKNKTVDYNSVAEEVVETVETPIPTTEPIPESIEETIDDNQNEVQDSFEEKKDEASNLVDSDVESDEIPNENVDEVMPTEDSDSSYAAIFEEYSQMIRDATPDLIKEYKKEVESNNKGLEGRAEIANGKVEKLANISNEGVEKMANVMWTQGSGNYDEYSDWASKLYDVYSEEADKIYDEYMK